MFLVLSWDAGFLDLAHHYMRSSDRVYTEFVDPHFRRPAPSSARASYESSFRDLYTLMTRAIPSSNAVGVMWMVLRDSFPPFALPMRQGPCNDVMRTILEVRRKREEMESYFAGDPNLEPFRQISFGGPPIAEAKLVQDVPGSAARPIAVDSPVYDAQSPVYHPQSPMSAGDNDSMDARSESSHSVRESSIGNSVRAARRSIW